MKSGAGVYSIRCLGCNKNCVVETPQSVNKHMYKDRRGMRININRNA